MSVFSLPRVRIPATDTFAWEGTKCVIRVRHRGRLELCEDGEKVRC